VSIPIIKIYRAIQKLVSLSGWTFSIYRSRPKVKWVEKYIDSIQVKMRLDLSESLDGSYAQGFVDENIISFMRDNLSNDSVFVDVGANQGFFSLFVLRNFPNATVLAIEPDPYSLEKFEFNLNLNNFKENNLRIIGMAAGTDNGKIELLINDGGNRSASSLLLDQRGYTKKSINSTITVTEAPLLDIIRNSEISKVDCMKLDIEGYEYPVLTKFFQDADKSIWPDSLIVEAHGNTINISGGSPINLIYNHGYTLVDHDEYNYMFKLKEQR
jgi:FkbM family methyltransferase